MIILRSDALAVTIDETMGGELRQIEFGGTPLLAAYEWDTPVPATRSRSYGDLRLDWLSEYRGGWQFLVPNAGAECVVDGVPLPFHGEWSRTAVDIDAATRTEVTMRAGTRMPFTVHRTVSLVDGPDRVQITTTIENEGCDRQPFVWGEHPAFLAGPGDRIDLPDGPVVDRDDETGTVSPWPSDAGDQNGLDVVPGTRPARERALSPGSAGRMGGPAVSGRRRRTRLGDRRLPAHVVVERASAAADSPSTVEPRWSRSSPRVPGPATDSPPRSNASRHAGSSPASAGARWSRSFRSVPTAEP